VNGLVEKPKMSIAGAERELVDTDEVQNQFDLRYLIKID
jgi:hypothetical protein